MYVGAVRVSAADSRAGMHQPKLKLAREQHASAHMHGVVDQFRAAHQVGLLTHKA